MNLQELINLNQFRLDKESLIKDFINDNKDKKEAALASKILDKGILAIVDEKERDNIIKLFSSNETVNDILSKNYNYLDSLYWFFTNNHLLVDIIQL